MAENPDAKPAESFECDPFFQVSIGVVRVEQQRFLETTERILQTIHIKERLPFGQEQREAAG